MEKIKLTKKEYLGKGYFYTFKKKDEEKFFIEYCSEEDYNKLSLPNAVNPTLEGCDFVSASGGSVKVDTPTGVLDENEYCEVDGKYAVCINTKKFGLITSFVEKDIIINDEADRNLIDIWQ